MIGRGFKRNKKRPFFLHFSVDEPLALGNYKIIKNMNLDFRK